MVDSGDVELGHVLEESPAAVLVVELSSRLILHVNDVAEQLAPGTRLPIGLDAWSDAAELRDPDGAELSDTDHPLSRIARAEPVAGQAVSASRRSAMGARREPLWMVAMPMTGAPMLEGHALVVLIPLRHSRAASSAPGTEEASGLQEAKAEAQLLGVAVSLRDRALDATALAVTVADAFDPEQPLVWVNPAFTTTTGYPTEEVLGRNCRFLQGPGTGTVGPRLLREAVEQGVSVSVTLLNYRKDGSAFWNQVDLSPVRDPDGRVAHFVGIQTDVTVRVEAEQETRRALEAERAARADAESARRRVTYLAEAVNQLSGTLDIADCVQRLLSLVVPYLADWAVVVDGDDLEDDRPPQLAGRHRHALRQAEVDAVVDSLEKASWDDAVDLLPAGTQARLVQLTGSAGAEELQGVVRDPSLVEAIRALDSQQALVVSLAGRSPTGGVLVLVRTSSRQSFTEEDTATAIDLCRRAGLMIETASLYQAQARIAEVLQRSLLTELPQIRGVSSAARYLANERSAAVGGDFYELLDFGDRGLSLTIGDVTGHDIEAAAAMGHLKGILRAAAYDHFDSPSAVLEQVDRVSVGLGLATMATAVVLHAVRQEPGWRLTWSSAGHPPLLVRHPDGGVEALPVGLNDGLLGLEVSPRTQHEVLVPPGATVVAYTDGLVERRREHLDEGLARLVGHVASGPLAVDLLCDDLVVRMSHEARDDDVALLVITLG